MFCKEEIRVALAAIIAMNYSVYVAFIRVTLNRGGAKKRKRYIVLQASVKMWCCEIFLRLMAWTASEQE